ncbi:MAG TPA: hypothetical protein VKB59_16110 [Micromonosporaceae bacterium]|nr:hypothetical protein [Micromonosporaceae bacterium]
MLHLEISDLITRHDPVTGAGVPVARSTVGLGPFTLIRPYLTAVAGIVGVWWSHDRIASISVALAVIGVLAVEPYVHRRWYTNAV